MSAPRTIPAEGISALYLTGPDLAAQAVAQLAALPLVGVDCETTDLDPLQGRLRLVQLAAPDGRVLILDAFAIGGQLAELLEPLRSVPLVAHGALFDHRWLTRAGFEPETLHCTGILYRAAHYGAKPNARMVSLAEAARLVLGLELDKEQQRSDWSAPELSDEQLAYAARDPLVTVRLADALMGRLALTGAGNAYRRTIRALPHLSRTMLRGIGVDWAALERASAAWAAERERLGLELAEQFPDMNWNSAKQIAALLAERLAPRELDRWPRTRKGQLQADKDTLERYGQGLPWLEPLLAYRRADKLIGLCGSPLHLADKSKARPLGSFRHPITDRAHAEYFLGLTDTGRMSCEKPPIQTMPRDAEKGIRALFLAAPGNVLVAADLGQIELRVAAALAGDAALAQALTSGADFHRQAAARTLKTAPETVTAEQRDAAKAATYGSYYGLTAYGLQRRFSQLTEAEAHAYLEQVRQTFPKLSGWLDEQQRLAAIGVPVRTLGGLARLDRDRRGSWPRAQGIQGSAAEVLCEWIAQLPANCPLVAVVHDELVLECPADHAGFWGMLLERTAEQAWHELFPAWPQLAAGLAEYGTGLTWAAAKGK